MPAWHPSTIRTAMALKASRFVLRGPVGKFTWLSRKSEQEDMPLEVNCRRTVGSIPVAAGELKALVEVLPRIRHVIGHIVNDEAGCNFALEIGVDIGTCERQQRGQC